MDEYHRQKIITNVRSLVEGTHNFDAIFNSLVEKNMFNKYMQNEILNRDAEDKLEFFYRYVTTRGPRAFRQLLDTLNSTDHCELAALLCDDRSYRVFVNGNCSNQLPLEEEFPCDEEWLVKRAVPPGFDLNHDEVYKMRSKPKGLALIINIRVFVNNTNDLREGSEHDVRRLQSILEQLDYRVIKWENLESKGILEKVREFAKEEEHWKCDSSIVFIMSHGQDNHHTRLTHTVNIVASDSQLVNSQSIIYELMGQKCEALRGKPKLFFFQACRGDHLNFPVTLTESGQKDHSPTRTDGKMLSPSAVVRNDSDILIGNSTSPGYASLRDADHGSWYIQTLCRVLAKHAWNKDIITMLQYVRQERNRQNRIDIYCQTNAMGFHKCFYFQPGIYALDHTANGS